MNLFLTTFMTRLNDSDMSLFGDFDIRAIGATPIRGRQCTNEQGAYLNDGVLRNGLLERGRGPFWFGCMSNN